MIQADRKSVGHANKENQLKKEHAMDVQTMLILTN